MSCNSATIMEALGNGPKTTDQMPGPRERIADRVRYFNVFNERIGSHWRVRGRIVFIPQLEGDGSKRRTVEYKLVMEPIELRV